VKVAPCVGKSPLTATLSSSPLSEMVALVGAAGGDDGADGLEGAGVSVVGVVVVLEPPELFGEPLDDEPDELPAVTCTANGSFDANLWNVCNWPGSADRGTASTRSEVVAVGVVVTTAAPPSVGAASEFGSDGVTVGVVVVGATTLTGAGFWFNIFIVFGTSKASSATSTTAPPIAIFFCLAAFAFATSCFEARFAMVMGLLPRTGRSAA
jgi:hypothetical protein